MFTRIIRYFFGGLLVLLAFSANVSASEATLRNAQIYPKDPSQRPLPLAACSAGISTSLELGGLSRSIRHNGNQGEAHFVLKGTANASVLWKDELVGEGICFGFNAQKRVYVIGSRKAKGIGVRLTDLRYVDEHARTSHVSAFNKRHLQAFAAVSGPNLHYVAFIAMDENETALFVLDVQKDALRKLGKAPLPPPLTPEEHNLVKKYPHVLAERWEWMASFRDGYMELDPGIVLFQGDHLIKVSYGNDTATQRANNRKVLTWDLTSGSKNER